MYIYNYVRFAGDFCVNVLNNYINNHSPWAFAEKVTHSVERGEAKPIESSRIMDLMQFLNRTTWTESLSSFFTLFRTVHVVNDEGLIKEVLLNSRSGKQFSIYPTTVNSVIGDPHNMLLCEEEDHKRYRQSFDKVFTTINQGDRSVLQKLALHALYSFASGGGGVGFMIGRLNKAMEEGFSEVERTSSIRMFSLAGTHTAMNTAKFIRSLLREHSQYAEQILLEWRSAFGEVEEDDLRGPSEGDTFEDLYAKIDQRTSDVSYKSMVEKLTIFIKGGEYKGKTIAPSKTVSSFLEEVLRLYPIVPQIARIAKTSFSLGATEIKPGDVLLLNVMGAQRDLKKWENPTKFNPNRFVGSLNHSSLLTFGYGAERCIGQHLARYSLLFSTVLSALEFAFNTKEEIQKGLDSLSEKIAPLQGLCRSALEKEKDVPPPESWTQEVLESWSYETQKLLNQLVKLTEDRARLEESLSKVSVPSKKNATKYKSVPPFIELDHL